MFSRAQYFIDLRTVLGTDELKKYEDRLYYVDQKVLEAIENGTYNEGADASAFKTASYTQDSEDQEKAQQEAVDNMLGYPSGSDVVKEEDFVKPDPSSMEEPVPIGIIVSDAPYLLKDDTYEGTVPVFGIIANSEHVDSALKFLDFLYH
jgi:hypothetical protein